MQGTAPALRAVDTIITSATSVAPGHYPLPYPLSGTAPTPTPSATPSASPTPTPVPVPGFEFDVKARPDASATSNNGWNFPSDNSGFGERKFNHVIDGTTYPAPVALFYPSTGFQHPSGGPKGYYYGKLGTWAEIVTPNWFYYYSKAGNLPCEIRYVNSDDSYYDHNSYSWANDHITGDDFVNIRNMAHGFNFYELFAKVPVTLSNGNMVMMLKEVGTKNTWGIDTFTHVVTHEYTHKRCIEALEYYADTDHDYVPDAWEIAVGLTVGDTDSQNFTRIHSDLKYDISNGDSEVMARIGGHGVQGDANQDWANDGLNFRLTTAAPLIWRDGPTSKKLDTSTYGPESSWKWVTIPQQ